MSTYPLGPDGPRLTWWDRLYKPARLRKLADHRIRTLGMTLRERAELVREVMR